MAAEERLDGNSSGVVDGGREGRRGKAQGVEGTTEKAERMVLESVSDPIDRAEHAEVVALEFPKCIGGGKEDIVGWIHDMHVEPRYRLRGPVEANEKLVGLKLARSVYLHLTHKQSSLTAHAAKER